jgi:hypothetical protein
MVAAGRSGARRGLAGWGEGVSESLFDALRLMTLIHELDIGLTNPEEGYEQPYLEIRRYLGRDNEIATEATALIRALLREKLATFPLDELGTAVLAEIDARSSA